MKRTCLGGVLLLLSLELCTGQNRVVPKLTGIVRFPASTRALLEWEGANRQLRTPILREGERDGEYEVLKIDEKEGIVSLNDAKSSAAVDLQITPGAPLSGRTLHFQNARLQQVLDVYQEFSDCTILRPQNIPNLQFTLQSDANLSSSNAAALLESALLQHGLLVRRKTNFIFVGRPDEFKVIDSIAPPPISIEPPPATPVKAQATQPAEVFPPGLIKFQETDLMQVLDVYAELANRTILQSSLLGAGKVTVRSQNPMSRLQAVWMMDALLRLAGVAMLPESTNFVFAVPPERTNGLPHFDEKAATAKIKVPAQLSEFRLSEASMGQILGFYADITGRKAVPLPDRITPMRLSLRSRRLTQAEIIFAFEGLAAANNFSFQLLGDDEVAIAPARSPATGK
jgi:hypothetical protein